MNTKALNGLIVSGFLVGLSGCGSSAPTKKYSPVAELSSVPFFATRSPLRVRANPDGSTTYSFEIKEPYSQVLSELEGQLKPNEWKEDIDDYPGDPQAGFVKQARIFIHIGRGSFNPSNRGDPKSAVVLVDIDKK